MRITRKFWVESIVMEILRKTEERVPSNSEMNERRELQR